MGARHKLNGVYFIGSVVVAAVIGGVANSWAAFFVALVVLVIAQLMSGDIRPDRRR